MPSAGLTGLHEIMATLKDLKDKTAKKAAKAGVNAGLQELSKEIRSRVNALPISGELKKALRQTIGKRLKKKEGQDYTGKAGFAVGKATKAKKAKAKARHLAGQGGAGLVRGVGISSANVHWLMGTAERQTDSGHVTGSMPDMLNGVIAQAADSAGPAMLGAMAKKIGQVLESDAKKK